MTSPLSRTRLSRRRFLRAGVATGAAGLIARPAIVRAERALPQLTHGLQTGDVGLDGAMLWARADRSARMIVELATTESFANSWTVNGPAMLEDSDFTGKLLLADLPMGQRMFYRVRLQSLDDMTMASEPVTGSFATPGGARDLSFTWSGDTAGQGWGINLDWGGMRIYEAMRGVAPDFFLHSGDTIYADGPIAAEVALPDGSLWRNVVTEEVAKVAETLAEFRGRYKYNLMDANVQAFNADVPIIAQWDDHETTNNWYPNEVLADERYASVQSVGLLSARANKAFLEYMPIAQYPDESGRVYRAIHRGPLLDLFVIDMRTYRGDNTRNDQLEAGQDTAFLGRTQLNWLKRQLLASRATWKVIAADMPIGMIVPDGDSGNFENLANGDGAPRGREFDIVEILKFIKDSQVENVVWLTADVHYTAAHYYDPNQAQFQDFTPFWEFVSGPLNAGSFGPSRMDNTFGPQVMFSRHPSAEQGMNLPPSAGMQFFGHVVIDAASEVMTVMLKDLEGSSLYSVEIEPQRGRAQPVWRQASAG